MKKLLILFALFTAGAALEAQNVQLHYDLGKDRKYLTSTVEMFKPDKWGSTFFFVDMDYGSGGAQGVSMGYFEISRGLKFWKSPFELHVEYNGGFGQFKATPFNGAYQINDAWLFGGNYTWNTSDFSKVFTLEAMYKNIRGKNDMSFQLTGVWTVQLLKNKVTLSGFADFWREDNIVGVGANTKSTNFVFLSEPQFWYNCTEHFSVGSEVEVSSNFAGHNGLMVNPTIAGKWNF
ncbi:MAG: DUF5020 family protein [Bacteroidia bacterium]|nr:DUF5020 family protein [Bacteroidia bacterium]